MKIEYYDKEDREYIENMLKMQKKRKRQDVLALTIFIMVCIALFASIVL